MFLFVCPLNPPEFVNFLERWLGAHQHCGWFHGVSAELTLVYELQVCTWYCEDFLHVVGFPD